MEKGLSGSREHRAEDFITKITACSPSEAGKKIWEEALDTFFLGDKELIEYVQITVGEAAVGKVFQEHMIIAYGGGANGKSTFWNTKGDSITFSTPTIEGTVLTRNKVDAGGRHPWKAEVTEGENSVSNETITNWYNDVYEPVITASNNEEG